MYVSLMLTAAACMQCMSSQSPSQAVKPSLNLQHAMSQVAAQNSGDSNNGTPPMAAGAMPVPGV
jgi:hypothetical protein